MNLNLKRFLRKWIALLKGLFQDPATSNRQLTGYAVVKHDDISGLNYWETYAADGSDRHKIKYGEPLILSPEKSEVGVIIKLYGVR